MDSLAGAGASRVYRLAGTDGRGYHLRTAAAPATVARYTGLTPAENLAAERAANAWLHSSGLAPAPVALGRDYFLREFVDGDSVERRLRAAEPPDALLERAVDLIAAAVRVALAHPHALWLDPSPSNIIVTAGGLALVDHEWARLRVFDYEAALGGSCGARFFGALLRLVPFRPGLADGLLMRFLGAVSNDAVTEACLQALDMAYRGGTEVSHRRERRFFAHCTRSSVLRRHYVRQEPGPMSGQLVRDLVAAMTRSGAAYTLGRDYDLPEGGGSFVHKDLDVFVREGDAWLLGTVLQTLGFMRGPGRSFFRFCPADDRIVHVDLHWGALRVAGAAYLDLERVIAARCWRDGRPVPAPVDLFLFHLLQPLFTKPSYKPEYWARLRADVLTETGIEGGQRLAALFGEALAAQLLRAVTTDDMEGAYRLRTALIRQLSRRAPGLLERARHAARRIAERARQGHGRPSRRMAGAAVAAARHLLPRRRQSRLVAFLGVDGAGKTTTLAAVARVLAANDLPCRALYLASLNMAHGRVNPLLIPYGRLVPIAQRLYRAAAGRVPGADPAGQPTAAKRGALRALERLLLPLALVDALAYSVVLGLRARADTVLLADRFFYDVLTISRGRAVQAALNLVIRPAVVFHLSHEDPEVLRQRAAARDHGRPDPPGTAAIYEEIPEVVRGVRFVPVESEHPQRVLDFVISQLLARRII